MAVAELVDHVAAHPEELLRAHSVSDQRSVAVMHLLPVHAFLLEETVMLVNGGPESLEVAFGVVGIVGNFVTRSQRRKYCKYYCEIQ